MIPKYGFLVFLLFSFGQVLKAQTIDKSYGQYRQVTKRTIRMADSVDIPDAASFTELLYNAALAGNIKAYATWNDPFETQFTRQELIDAIDGKPTAPTPPAVNKKGPAKAPPKPPVHHFGLVKKVRVLEEWTMNKWDGTTTSKILGIAPMQDMFGEDGNYRGGKPLFWVHYDEAFPILEKYAVKYPGNNPLNAYWADLQSDDAATTFMKSVDENSESAIQSMVWKKKVYYMLELTQKPDNVKRHFFNTTDDKVLFQYLNEQLLSGTTRLFDGNANSMTRPITNSEMRAMLTPPPNDTMMSVDPATGINTMRVVKRDDDFASVSKYVILQDCTFDRAKGVASMHIDGLMPLETIYDDAGQEKGLKRYFWINYDDKVKQVVQIYTSLNPRNDLLLNLWEEFFKRLE